MLGGLVRRSCSRRETRNPRFERFAWPRPERAMRLELTTLGLGALRLAALADRRVQPQATQAESVPDRSLPADLSRPDRGCVSAVCAPAAWWSSVRSAT